MGSQFERGRVRTARPAAAVLLAAAAAGLVHAVVACSSDDATDDGGGGGQGTGAAGGAGLGGTGGAAGEGGVGGEGGSDDPCSADALAEPTASVTYYLAVDEPGASNEACDGLAPTDEGDGRCPFKDFSSPAVRALLVGAVDVRFELRAGTYVIEGWDGLRIEGAGTSESERLIVSAYPGETPILDVPSPDGAGCTTGDPTTNPDCVRQVARVAGTYTWVQGLTIQNGLAYDLEINGGAHHVFRCNKLRYTAEFAQRSDQLKIDGGADDVLVQHNELTGWRSQAIDMTEVSNVIIEENDFHDPFDPDGAATGTKLGSQNVIIRNNTVHDLGPDTQTHAFTLGGTGTPHDHDFSAYELQLVGNRVWNVAGILAQVVSCRDCTIEDNVAFDIGAGILVSAAGGAQVGECTTAPGGICLPSEGLRIAGNQLAVTSDIFVVVEAGQGAGLVGSDNFYCASTVAAARFGWQATPVDPMEMVDFASWKSLSATDGSSLVFATGSAACDLR